MAMLLQNMNFVFDDPNYALHLKQTLTIKPKNLYLRAVLREGLTPNILEHRLAGGSMSGPAPTKSITSNPAKKPSKGPGKPMSIFYGSNTGTCEALANSLATEASTRGFDATTEPLDVAKQNVPKDRPVVFITASFEGEPPDNARLFCHWLETLEGSELEGLSYAVFGVGHHEWAQTFHRIPNLVDSLVEAHGGNRLCKLGLADAAKGQIFTDFEQWEDEAFYPAMEAKHKTEKDEDSAATGFSVEFSTPRSSTLRQDVQEALVVANKDLTATGAPVKKHLEIKMASDAHYKAGDYMAVLPINPSETIHRAMRHFQLAWDTNITIASDRKTTLPTDVAVPVHDLLGAYVELSQPATKRVSRLN
jgi:cytochrome P450 / NADPH-cytochrome P450 reductase